MFAHSPLKIEHTKQPPERPATQPGARIVAEESPSHRTKRVPIVPNKSTRPAAIPSHILSVPGRDIRDGSPAEILESDGLRPFELHPDGVALPGRRQSIWMARWRTVPSGASERELAARKRRPGLHRICESPISPLLVNAPTASIRRCSRRRSQTREILFRQVDECPRLERRVLQYLRHDRFSISP